MNKKYANVGGQAVIEGRIRECPGKTVRAVRAPSGDIVAEDEKDF